MTGSARALNAPTFREDGRFSVSYTVYYEDTDSLGMVYYANYFRFLERGRTEYLAAAGHNLAEYNANGIAFVVHSVNAKFKKPAVLGDVIDVTSTFSVPAPFKGVFDQRVERDGEVLVQAEVTVACTDAEGNLRRFPEEMARGS